MNIIDPIFSFVQFSDGNLSAVCNDILPIALNTDLKFQSIVETASYTQSVQLLATDQKLYVVKEGAIITNETTLALNTLIALTNVFDKTQTADTKILMCWLFGLVNIESLAAGTCFRLCIRVQAGSSIQYFISNCFVKITDVIYTSTLEYYSDEDNYGFDYCNGCSNKIRLEFYVGSPEPKEVQSVYIKTTGERKLLSYNASKLYEFITNFLSDSLHDKIINALAHDHVNMEGSRYVGGIRKDGDYTITWDDPKDLIAPASTKVFSDTYVKNNNCVDCVTYLNVTCGAIAAINAVSETTPVACASIASINGNTVEQVAPGVFSVSLLRSNTQLAADVSGGVPPYNYHFYCVPVGGSCQAYTIDTPDQSIYGLTAVTNYSTIRYFGVVYNFYIRVIDSTLAIVTAGPNATPMCLVPNTLITMADSTKRALSEIYVGDKLLTYDLITKEPVITTVTAKAKYVVGKRYSINNGLLLTSEGHVNIIKNNDEFILVQSDLLKISDKLVDDTLNDVMISSIEITEGDFDVINISTDTSTYIANAILTHNKVHCP